AVPLTLGLLPGSHTFNRENGTAYSFTVADNGTIVNDPTLAAVASIAGSTLSLLPLQQTVTINATALNTNWLWVDGVARRAAAPITVGLLPGRHTFMADGGSVCHFTVNANGTLTDDYDGTALDGIVDVQGLNLTVRGRAVAVDARALNMPALWIDSRAVFGARDGLLNMNLLPGGPNLFSYRGSGLKKTVSGSGTVSYAAALEGILTGSGTSRLNVVGRAITIDAQLWGVTRLWIDGVPFATDANGRLTLNLLPGRHSFFRENGPVYYFDVL